MSTVSRELRLAAESIPGRREVNQDSSMAEVLPDGRVLLAVADGMGGHAAGEVASSLALEILRGALREGRSLREGIELANARVNARSQDPGKKGMGTTLVAVLVAGDEYQVANVGDSRAYLLRDAGIVQLTEDHSFLVEAMKRGQSAEEAMASRWRDALTRSVGIEESVEVDLFGPYAVEPDSALLLCSDGLYKTLPDEGLMEAFRRSRGAEEGAQILVSVAYEGGSDDNITVVVGEWGEVPRRAPAPSEGETDGPPTEALPPAADGGTDEAPPERSAEVTFPTSTDAPLPAPASEAPPTASADLDVAQAAPAPSDTRGLLLALLVVLASALAGFFLFGR